MLTKFERLEKKANMQITQKTLEDIFNAYKKLTCSKSEKYPLLEEFISAINHHGQYVIGAESKWSSKSTMMIDDTFGCSFQPNCLPRDMENKEIKAVMTEFRKEANKYLGIFR